jgi:hypothetical protein
VAVAVAMRLGVVPGRVFGVFDGVQLVAMRDMRVVAGCHVVARLMVFCRFAVMMRRVVQMLGGFVVMMMRRMFFAHGLLLRNQNCALKGRPE